MRAVWLRLQLSQGDLMAAAGELGFTFHHSEKTAAVLVAWLPDTPNSVPLHATHQLGVGGIVLDGRGHVLTIREKNGTLA